MFVLLIIQTHHRSDSVFQTTPDRPPHLSHSPGLQMEPCVCRLPSQLSKGQAAEKKPRGHFGGLHQLAVLPEDWGQADVLGGDSLSPPSHGSWERDSAQDTDGAAGTRALSRGIATLPQPGSFLAPSDSLNMRIGRGNNIC